MGNKTIRKTSDLKPYPDNPRIHGDGSGLSKSILELGDLSGVVFNVRNKLLVGGHYRTKTVPKESIIESKPVKDSTGTVAEGTIILPGGQRLNYREVDWDETKHKLACVEANNQEIQGDWDEESLEPLLADLNEDLPEGDFDEYGLDLLADEFNFEFEFKEENNNDHENIPEEQENIVIKKGDLIELENHRLLCGDSTNLSNIKKLIGKNSIDICFTDPMYDDDTKPICNALKSINTDDYLLMCTLKQGINYINEDWLHFKFDLVLNQVLPSSMMNKLVPYYLHKNILYLRKNTKKESLFHCDNAAGVFSDAGYYPSIIEAPKNVKDEHGLSKNVDGIIKILSGFKAQTVADIFLGGGSTLIACEMTNRVCFGLELEPKNIQICIQRWCDYTEKNDIKINNKTKKWGEYKNSC